MFPQLKITVTSQWEGHSAREMVVENVFYIYIYTICIALRLQKIRGQPAQCILAFVEFPSPWACKGSIFSSEVTGLKDELSGHSFIMATGRLHITNVWRTVTELWWCSTRSLCLALLCLCYWSILSRFPSGQGALICWNNSPGRKLPLTATTIATLFSLSYSC